MTLKQDLANTHVFPVATIDGYTQTGITLRQHYAGIALQGLLARYGDSESERAIASWAVEYADNLIAELSK